MRRPRAHMGTMARKQRTKTKIGPGDVIGELVAGVPPDSDAGYFYPCPVCFQPVDERDLAQVAHHEQKRHRPIPPDRLKTAAGPRPSTAAVTDPQSPETIAWLESLPPRERAITLHAMMLVFPKLQRNYEWKRRIGDTQAELDPTTEELGDMLREASRQAERLRDALGVPRSAPR